MQETAQQPANTAAVYQTATIIGYKVRHDTDVPGLTPTGIGNTTRLAKVYELRGAERIYQIDYCGAFQAGKFSPGQVVQFRVDRENDRVYVRHSGNKEYSCQLEGTRLIDSGDSTAASDSADTSTVSKP